MPAVKLTSHLNRYFPQLESEGFEVAGTSVRAVILSLERLAPGLSGYLLDDTGALRPHILVSVDEHLLVDRIALSDKVSEDSTVFIFQALTGG